MGGGWRGGWMCDKVELFNWAVIFVVPLLRMCTPPPFATQLNNEPPLPLHHPLFGNHPSVQGHTNKHRSDLLSWMVTIWLFFYRLWNSHLSGFNFWMYFCSGIEQYLTCCFMLFLRIIRLTYSTKNMLNMLQYLNKNTSKLQPDRRIHWKSVVTM